MVVEVLPVTVKPEPTVAVPVTARPDPTLATPEVLSVDDWT